MTSSKFYAHNRFYWFPVPCLCKAAMNLVQSHLGKCSKRNLRTSTLVNGGTLRSTADFASALRNVNNVEISDLLEFFVLLLVSSLCSHLKIICRKLQEYENIHGGD